MSGHVYKSFKTYANHCLINFCLLLINQILSNACVTPFRAANVDSLSARYLLMLLKRVSVSITLRKFFPGTISYTSSSEVKGTFRKK